MKTASRVLPLAVVVISGVCCQRLLQNVPEVGLGSVVKVGSDTSGRFSDPDIDDGGSTMEEELVVALEKDEQVTGKTCLLASRKTFVCNLFAESAPCSGYFGILALMKCLLPH